MQSMKHMKKHVVLVLSLVAGSALVLAQSGSQDRRAGTPGHPDWKGQTLQTSPAPANADVGGLDPMDIIRKPLSDQWTSYSGDMSGKRFSHLKLVNTNTVKNLSLKWVSGLTTGCGPTGRPPVAAGGGGFGGGRGGAAGAGNPTTVTMADGSTIKGTLVRKDDWLVILILPDGTRKSMARTNGVPKVDVKDPKDPHKTMVLELDDPENKKMHDVTAYLSTIK